jgi:hypothetical protein
MSGDALLLAVKRAGVLIAVLRSELPTAQEVRGRPGDFASATAAIALVGLSNEESHGALISGV